MNVGDLLGGFWAKALLVLAILGLVGAGVMWIHNTGVEHCQNESNKALLAQKADYEKKLKELHDKLAAEHEANQKNVVAAAKEFSDYQKRADKKYRELQTEYQTHATANPADRCVLSDRVREFWNSANRGSGTAPAETPR